MQMINDLKQALAFAVGVGNSLVMLYILIKILIYKQVIVAEPILIILISEIILGFMGIFYLWRIFKLNHKIMVV